MQPNQKWTEIERENVKEWHKSEENKQKGIEEKKTEFSKKNKTLKQNTSKKLKWKKNQKR